MPAANWTVLHEYGARWEADPHIAALEDAGIPVLVKGPETGIFGPGFAGATPLGVKVLVPQDRLAEARRIVGNEGGEDGE